MPFNSSGVFTRVYNWATDRDNGTKIIAERMDAEDDGIVKGLNDVVDGTQGFIGAVKGTNGTATSPAYSFTDDSNTGMYRSGADVLGFAVNGALEGKFEAGFFDAVNGLKVGGVDITAIGGFLNTFTLPDSDGTDGQVLSTDGAGALVFETPSSGGASIDVQEFSTSGTYTPPEGATWVLVKAVGAGGGGSAGERRPSGEQALGGNGGGGGAYVERLFKISDIGATEAVTIPAGGSGGAANTTDSTNGAAGTAGGSTTFGGLLTAYGGSQASFGGGIVGGDGGGVLQFLRPFQSTDQLHRDFGGAKGGLGTGSPSYDAGHSGWGGGGGGACRSVLTGGNDGKASSAGQSFSGGGGGGAGAGITAADVVQTQSGAGGDGSSGSGGAAGATSAGGNGSAGAVSGGGGGGGSANGTYAGGNGARGGGGGGAGGVRNGTDSGAGGNGGDGYLVAISW